jgi:superfamily II DNA or RNA helicase
MSKILMRRSGNLVEAIPQAGITIGGLHELLRRHFKYGLKLRNDRRIVNLTGQKFRTEPRYLCRLQQGPTHSSVVFTAGLTHRATKLFQQCGIDWDIQDLRPLILPPPRLDCLQHELLKDRDDQNKCLATIFAADMGVIDSPTAWGKTFLIEQLARAYPSSNIIVCTYRRDVVNSLFERLNGHVPPQELGRVGGGFNSPRRVTVSTIDSLQRCAVDKCRLFLYDEVHEAAAEERMRKIGGLRNCRMFGFSASPEGRSDGADLAIEAMFGPVIYVLPYQEAESKGRVATITVHVYRVPGVPISYDNDVAQFRYGVWRNQLRNQMVAHAASTHAMQEKQVLIMVDKVEHALHLKANFLPQWPLVHGPVQAEQVRTFRSLGLLPQGPGWLCTSEHREQYRRRFERGTMKFAIATGVWSQGVDFRHLDVLVRADGRSAPISNTQIPGRLSRGQTGLLVDFDDGFDKRFKTRSNARLRHYRGKGWTIHYP